MTMVIRDKIRQLIEIDLSGTPVKRTREKLWQNI